MQLKQNEKIIIGLVVVIAAINFYLQNSTRKKMEELKTLIKNK